MLLEGFMVMEVGVGRMGRDGRGWDGGTDKKMFSALEWMRLR